MKNTFITLFVFLFVLLSCSSDDKPSITVKESDLVGTWSLIDLYTESGSISGSVLGQSFTSDFSIKGKDFDNATTTFSQNPNVVYDSGKLTLSTEIVSFGNYPNLEEKEIIADPSVKGLWSVSGNTITLSSSLTGFQKEIKGEVIAIDANNLKIKASVLEQDFSSVNLQLPIEIDDLKVKTTIYIVYKR